ncbi:MAG: sugar ABC transporter permease, partial [Devosia sp.]
MTGNRNASLFAFALLAPALLYIIGIVAYPLVDTVNLSFTNAALKPTYSWVGWFNYQKIFKANFDQVIIRTFIWTFFSVLIKMVIGTL